MRKRKIQNKQPWPYFKSSNFKLKYGVWSGYKLMIVLFSWLFQLTVSIQVSPIVFFLFNPPTQIFPFQWKISWTFIIASNESVIYRWFRTIDKNNKLFLAPASLLNFIISLLHAISFIQRMAFIQSFKEIFTECLLHVKKYTIHLQNKELSSSKN